MGLSPFLKHRVVLVSDVILFYICPPFSAAIMLVTEIFVSVTALKYGLFVSQ